MLVPVCTYRLLKTTGLVTVTFWLTSLYTSQAFPLVPVPVVKMSWITEMLLDIYWYSVYQCGIMQCSSNSRRIKTAHFSGFICFCLRHNRHWITNQERKKDLVEIAYANCLHAKNIIFLDGHQFFDSSCTHFKIYFFSVFDLKEKQIVLTFLYFLNFNDIWHFFSESVFLPNVFYKRHGFCSLLDSSQRQLDTSVAIYAPSEW